jgi:hypothetical protein
MISLPRLAIDVAAVGAEDVAVNSRIDIFTKSNIIEMKSQFNHQNF